VVAGPSPVGGARWSGAAGVGVSLGFGWEARVLLAVRPALGWAESLVGRPVARAVVWPALPKWALPGGGPGRNPNLVGTTTTTTTTITATTTITKTTTSTTSTTTTTTTTTTTDNVEAT